MEGTVSCSPRTFEGSFSSLSSSPCPAHLAVQDSRDYLLPIGPPALAGTFSGAQSFWFLPIGGFAKNGLLAEPPCVHLCQALCWEQRTLSCSKADHALPSWGSQ